MFVEELDAKEKQLQKMEKVSTDVAMEVSKMKAKYSVLQKEALEYRQRRNDTEGEEMSAKMLEYEIQLEEYKVCFKRDFKKCLVGRATVTDFLLSPCYADESRCMGVSVRTKHGLGT